MVTISISGMLVSLHLILASLIEMVISWSGKVTIRKMIIVRRGEILAIWSRMVANHGGVLAPWSRMVASWGGVLAIWSRVVAIRG